VTFTNGHFVFIFAALAGIVKYSKESREGCRR
jgi:hypothetical protein